MTYELEHPCVHYRATGIATIKDLVVNKAPFYVSRAIPRRPHPRYERRLVLGTAFRLQFVTGVARRFWSLFG